MKHLTVSRAAENEEGTDAAWGLKGSRGALFWILRAISAILRREADEPSGPNETVWTDRGVLEKDQKQVFTRKR